MITFFCIIVGLAIWLWWMSRQDKKERRKFDE